MARFGTLIIVFVFVLLTSTSALDNPSDDLDIDLDAPNLADDDFQEMMDEDDVPVGPVLRHKWRNAEEGSMVARGPVKRPLFALAPLPAPTAPTRVTKVEPTAGVGIGFYAPSRNLYRSPAGTPTPPWPTGPATAAALAPMAPAWVAPKYAAAPPPPAFPPPHHPAPLPPRILQRQWHPQRFVYPYLQQQIPYPPRPHPAPHSGVILSMGK